MARRVVAESASVAYFPRPHGYVTHTVFEVRGGGPLCYVIAPLNVWSKVTEKSQSRFAAFNQEKRGTNPRPIGGWGYGGLPTLFTSIIVNVYLRSIPLVFFFIEMYLKFIHIMLVM